MRFSFQLHERLRLAGVFSLLFITTVGWAADYLSPEAIIPFGGNLIVAEATANRIVSLDPGVEGYPTVQVDLPGRPTGLTLARDGKTLYVTVDAETGLVCAVDVESQAIRSIPVGNRPKSPVVGPKDTILYVCNQFDNMIVAIDLIEGRTLAQIAVPREPIAAVLSADGKHLFVANHLPAGASDGSYVSGAISVIDTTANRVVKTIDLPNGSTDLMDICISPDGAHVYVTHILARYQLPTTQLERGWMNTNALTIIDAGEIQRINTVLLDDVDLGAANPWGVTCSPDGKYICVAHAGAQDVSIIDRAAMHDKLARAAKGERVSDASSSAEDVVNDLAFLVGVRRRLPVAGNGPRGIAVLNGKVYVTEYFTDSLGVVDLDPESVHRPTSIALGPKQEMTIIRKGERLFHDASLCFQEWQSCVSCHPDVRADALNWDLLNDGMGNPKNTKSLVLAHATPPSMSLGVRSNAEIAVRAGIRHIQFAVRPEEDAVAIDEYLKSLKPVMSPHRVKGALSAAAQRGEKIFESAGCAHCHPAPLYTDLKSYDVGTGRAMEVDKPFDTPTLREVWRTGPYLHDGRAATLKDVFTKYNKEDRHGKTSGLSAEELDDLIEFVLSN